MLLLCSAAAGTGRAAGRARGSAREPRPGSALCSCACKARVSLRSSPGEMLLLLELAVFTISVSVSHAGSLPGKARWNLWGKGAACGDAPRARCARCCLPWQGTSASCWENLPRWDFSTSHATRNSFRILFFLGWQLEGCMHWLAECAGRRRLPPALENTSDAHQPCLQGASCKRPSSSVLVTVFPSCSGKESSSFPLPPRGLSLLVQSPPVALAAGGRSGSRPGRGAQRGPRCPQQPLAPGSALPCSGARCCLGARKAKLSVCLAGPLFAALRCCCNTSREHYLEEQQGTF